jgi:SET domain-containing protein
MTGENNTEYNAHNRPPEVDLSRVINELLERRRSQIHGFGTFAREQIPAGKTFYEISLAHVSTENHPNKARIGADEFGRDLYVSDEVLDYVNHSPNSNTALDIDVRPPALKALRDIVEHEEITCNYGLTETEGDAFFRAKVPVKSPVKGPKSFLPHVGFGNPDLPCTCTQGQPVNPNCLKHGRRA